MPAKVKIKILSCKNLPVMDRANATTDAFVEVKLGNITYKTDVKRKSLNPVFNSQWFRYEIDDQEIQDEVLQIRVMDYDTYSANDAIGKVCLSLNPLLLQNDSNGSKGFSGYIPIYDTMNGIRGEINFIVKVELFSDSNKFRQSSCGVQFFHTSSIPFGYHAVIRGFVEEMIVDDDPEHDWIDKIRRASASNEARQQTFMRLAGQIQRKIGLKVLNLGGNAVIGFQQRFDLEKDTIIARGIGTCVLLVKIQSEQLNTSGVPNIPEDEKISKFSSSKSSFAKLETIFDEQYSRKTSLEAEQWIPQSKLSVPSISVDNVDGTSIVSTISTNYDSTSLNDDKRSELDTVSMIVRNVEAFAMQEFEAQKVSPRTKHEFLNELKEKFHHLGSKKNKEGTHDVTKKKEILHDLKENVNHKFHQIAEKIHHIHLPHLHHETDESLVSQAMQTILLEKFNIVEASSGIHPSSSSEESGGAKRKTSSTSLQSIKQKFNLFQKPRRSVDLSNETSSLKSISEINSQANNVEKAFTLDHEENLSIDELKIHEDTLSEASIESTITVLPSSERLSLKAISKEDLKLSVQNFDLILKTNSHGATFADTNKPLHESLLSLSRNELLSASPNIKTHARTESIGCKMMGGSPSKQQQQQCGSLPIKDASSNICRRSSDSDLSITPKGNSLTPANFERSAMKVPSAVLKPNQDNSLDTVLEYPFLTLTKYPPGFIIHIGATVSARSVKLLDKSTANPEDMETRDSWFNELRMEIRGHAKSLGCNVVLGYTETASINDDVSVLSASGTAAVINLNYNSHEDSELKITKTGASINPRELLLTTSVEETIQILEENAQKIAISSENGNSNVENEKTNGEDANNDVFNTSGNTNNSSGSNGISQSYCNLYHIPYSRSSIQIGGASIGKCCLCKRGYVPDVILATIELPELDGLSVIGIGTLIQATVCRPKRDLRSESNAKEISDALPFLEYELHRLLINKLKVKGMNAIFRLSIQVSIGDKIMSLIATGTAVYLAALHPPVVPKIVAGNSFSESSDKLAELQKTIQNTVEKNRERYQLTNQLELTTDQVQKLNKNFSDTEDSDNEEKLDYAIGNKQTCILEIDDIQDLELYSMLTEQYVPEGINIVNAQNLPGQHQNIENMRNVQTFVQVWRTKLVSSHQSNSNFSRHFQRLLQSIFFKLRFAVPCHICNLQFQLDLPTDEIQLLITGIVLKAAANKSKSSKIVHSISHDKKFEDELMFSLEEEETEITAASQAVGKDKAGKKGQQFNNLAKITSRNDKFVDISPLSFVPGAKVEKYLGNLSFCFIRETQNVRDYGGICGFVHSFISELLAIMRAHISALGGNMMLAFYMTELILSDNPHKNQAQLLINSGGDAVYCTYPTDDN